MPIKYLKQSSVAEWRNRKYSPTKKMFVKKSTNSSLNSYSNKSWHKNDKNNSWKKRLLKKLIVFGLALAFIGGIVAFITVLVVSRNLPSPDQLIDRQVAQSTIIYDRSGENILYEISGDERRTLINIDDIPSYVPQAVIAIEDKNFYNHSGFSLFAIFRTAITNVLYNRSAGGSTLTQQFVKNAVLTNEKRITRKIKEIIISYRLEKKFSKNEILQMYLNEIPYGSNAYGIEAASQKYFGKSVKEVSLAEAAVLGAIVQLPSRYSPYGPNKDILLGRKDYVLKLMKDQGYISEDEMNAALEQEIEFKGRETNITAPHFVMYIKDILASKYGEKMIEQGGLKIYTTLDLEKQKIAEAVIKEKTEKYPENFNANNAALVAIDPKTGQILAMVGSKDYFNDEIDGQVNVAIRNRQPGSSIKPLVYATLFEKGYTPNTLLYDVNTNFSSNPNEPYEPKNYNLQELGPVTIRKALAGSLNIPAVKALYLAGLNNVISLLTDFGYSTFGDKDRFGLAFVLGGAEVKMLEHVNAYSAFANDGEIRELSGILKVLDNNGEIIEEYKENKKTVLNQQSARMINEILSDNSARAYIFGEKNYLTLGAERPVAAKTGTTNDFHDAWTVGYTPSLVAGVWIGNSNNEKMSNRADGSVVAAPIWNEFMKRSLQDTNVEQFIKPDDYKTGIAVLDGESPFETIKIDSSTGLPINYLTDPSLIKEVNIPVHHNILYYINKDKPREIDLNTSESDPQSSLWEESIISWVKRTSSSTEYQLVDLYNQFKDEKNNPTINLFDFQEGKSIKDNIIKIAFNAKANLGVSLLNYYLNDNLILSTFVEDKENYEQELNLDKLPNGFNSFSLEVCDPYQNCSIEKRNFNLSLNNNNYNNYKNSVEIINPQSGLAASIIDFPLTLTINILNPDNVYKLQVLVKNLDNSLVSSNFLTKNLSQTNYININIEKAGSYYIIPEIRDYAGNNTTGESINITVK